MSRIAGCCLLTLCALVGLARSAEDDAKAAPPVPSHRVVVYYLHNTWRCPGCNSVESLSRVAVLGGKGENSKAGTEIDVESPFADDIEAGRLSFESVNIDPEENGAVLKALEKTLKVPVVAEVKDDAVVAFTPLKAAWAHLDDDEAFVRYVQEATEAILKKVRSASDDAGKQADKGRGGTE